LFCDSDCVPPVPFLPDPGAVDACAECFQLNCQEPLESCLEDDACTEQLACESECDDPGCYEDCLGLAGMDGFSPFADDLVTCKTRACAEECQVGQNWACVGEFRWPKAEVQSVERHVRFGTSLLYFVGIGNESGSRITLAGASVRVCESAGCRAGSTTLDAANGAVVELSTGNTSGSFRGFFDVESDEIGPVGTHYRVYFTPIVRAGLSELPIITELAALQTLGWLPSPETAALWVYVGDCLYQSGARVRIELPARPEAAVAHATPSGLSLDAGETTAGVAFFPYLDVSPPALSNLLDSETVTVQAVLLGDDPKDDRVVARREVSLRKGWTTIAALGPLAAGD
jgi:hypothetical protein